MELDYYKKKPEEVTEEQDVSDHGTLVEYVGLQEEPVNQVITTEPNKTKKYIESDKLKETELKITLLLKLI